MKLDRLSLFFVCAILLTACGGGGEDNATSATVLQGVLIDAAVEGVRAETPTQSGLTDASGKFNYIAGEVVSFYIGDVLLGSATGAKTITPLDFISSASDETDLQVTNILRFVQSLDSDSNPENGIQITAATRAALTGQTLNFSLSEATFETTFNSISSTMLGGVSLVPATDAQAHMRATLNTLSGESADEQDQLGLTVTGVDTSIFGTSFLPSPGTSAGDNPKYISWSIGNTDADNLGRASGLAIGIVDNQLASVNFSFVATKSESGTAISTQSYNYHMGCWLDVAPDCVR